jgi:hypothetical protein
MQTRSRLPSILHAACWIMLAVLPIVLVLAALQGGFGADAVLAKFPDVVRSVSLSSWQVAAAAVMGLLPWFVAMWLLWRIRGLFDLYRRGKGLTQSAAGEIRTVGLGLMILGFVKLVAHTGQILILSAANAPGDRVLAIQFGTGELGFLFAGGLMLAIGQSMREAVAAAEELRGFV